MARHVIRCLFLLPVFTLLPQTAHCVTDVSLLQRPSAVAEAAAPGRLLEALVSLSTLEAGLLADAADGRLDEHSLLEAALVAGGVDDPETITFHEDRVAVLTERLRRSGAVRGTPREQVRAVFEFMHGEMLHGGYRLDASDLTTVLNKGRFNCVSASVLFCCLCDRFGITAEGLEIPGHAMVRVALPGEELDVEATCPAWFGLIDDPVRREELIRRTLGRQSPALIESDQFRRVSGVQLIATIYYNRGVDLLGRKRFAEAMAANYKAVRLDGGNRTAWGNLLATLNNWAIDAGGKGRFADAVALLETGLVMEPDFQAFAGNYTHVYHRWVEALCRQGRHEEALARLEKAARLHPEEPWFRRASQDVYRHWTQTAAEAQTAR